MWLSSAVGLVGCADICVTVQLCYYANFFFVDFVLYSSIIQYQICMYMLACNFICLRVPKWMGRRQGLSVLSHKIGSESWSEANPRLPAHHWWGTGWGTLGYGFKWGMRCPTCTPTPTKHVNLPRGFPYPCQSLTVLESVLPRR